MKSTRLLLLAFLAVVLTGNLAAVNPNNWIGPQGGGWSQSGYWSLGLPGPLDDVLIYTGGDDFVALDTSSSINSLTLGGTAGGSVLVTDNAAPHTLTLAGGLNLYSNASFQIQDTAITVGANSQNAGGLGLVSGASATINANFDNVGFGVLAVDQGSTFVVDGTLSNSGTIELGASPFLLGGKLTAASLNNTGSVSVAHGAILMVTGGPLITDIPRLGFPQLGAFYDIAGTFTIAGGDPFASLNTIEGQLRLHGQTTNITPGSGSLTLSSTAFLQVEDSSSVTVNGDLVNNGYLATGQFGAGNTLTVNGTLTNNSTLEVHGPSDVLNAVSLANNGSLNVYGYAYGFEATLNVASLVNTGSLNVYGPATVLNAGDLSNTGSLGFYGTGTVLNAGSLTNNGNMFLDNETVSSVNQPASLTVNGDLTNNGYFSTGQNIGGGNVLTVTGTVFNNQNFDIYGANDVVNLGGLINNNHFDLYGSGAIANLGPFANNGSIFVGKGATLNLYQPGGITDIPVGSGFQVAGTVNSVLDSANGFFNLTSVEGYLHMGNQQATNITPGGNLLSISNTGELDASQNSIITITGDVYNAGLLSTGKYDLSPTVNTLTVSGNLLNDAGGSFSLYGSGDVANVGTLSNSGFVYVAPGATLNLTNQFSGITDIPAGAGFQVAGTVNNLLTANNGLVGVNSIEGYLHMQNGQTTDIYPSSFSIFQLTIANTGEFDVGGHSTVNINLDVDNSGVLSTGTYDLAPTANTITVAGNFYNEPNAFLNVNGAGDVVNVGTLSNYGTVFVASGATLNLTNQPGGITDIPYASSFDILGTINSVAENDTGFVNLTSVEGTLYLENGAVTTTTPGNNGVLTISSTGAIHVFNNSTFNVNGSVDNFGYLGADPSTIIIAGTLTNEAGSVFNLTAGDMLQVGGLVNKGAFSIPDGATFQSPRFDSIGSTSVSALATLLVGTGTAGNTGYYQLANGTLGEFIDTNGFGVIVALNGAKISLDGTLDIQLQAGFNPAVGTTYDFITFGAGDLTGTFASMQNAIFNNGTEKWVVIYNDAGGYVELLAQSNGQSSTPEPSTFLLLGTGLIGLSYGLRKRLSR